MITTYPVPLNNDVSNLQSDVSSLQSKTTENTSDISELETAVSSLTSGQWRLLYLEKQTVAFGPINTGSNFSQGWGFTFNHAVSWQTMVPTALVQVEGIEAHVAPVSNTSGKLTATNMRNTTIAASIARLYILTKDPTLTVAWS